MTDDPTPENAPPRPPTVAMPAIWALASIMVVIEAMLSLSPYGLSPLDRNTAYLLGGFWAPVLRGIEPVYAIQPVTMFVTHAFLHGGLGHLALNVTVLLSLGRIVVMGAGQIRAVLFFFLCAIGGAGAYGALAGPELIPMVGASGAVFGFVAAWKRWEIAVLRRMGASTRPAWRFLFWFLAINVALSLAFPALAWQAHAGGFATGWLFAPLIRRTTRFA
ncbi:MAG: rhomboid family intramembrane serine protease [Rubricella sp.]